MTVLRILITVLAIAFLASASTGCSIMDELDGAHKDMRIGEDKAAKKTQVAKKNKKPTKSQRMAKAKRWWKEVGSLSPVEVNESIGKCTVNGQVKYMTRDDCQSRGGVVGSG